MLYSINWPNLIAWLSLLLEILVNVCIAIVCQPSYDVINFKINLVFPIKSFFIHDQKFKRKTYLPWEQKRPLKMKQKNIFHQANKTFFLEGEEPTLN